MKKTLFFSLAIFFAFLSHSSAQNITTNKLKTESKLGLYYWNYTLPMIETNLTGDSSGTAVLSKIKQKFKVVKVTEDYKAIIIVLDYTTDKGKDEQKLNVVNFNVSPEFYAFNFKGSQTDFEGIGVANQNARNYGRFQRYFKISLSDLDAYATKDYKVPGSLAFGVINYPFKYRPQKSKRDFTGAFNFGAALGYTFPHKGWRKFKFSMLTGYSISNTVLDSVSTTRNQQDLLKTNNFTAFSFSFGALFEYERVQAGGFLGWDRLSRINQEQYGWQYQGKPWLSIGFGYSIFSTEKIQEGKDKVQGDQ